MNPSTTTPPPDTTDYSIVGPISIAFALIAIVIALFILFIILRTKQLHTVNHLLICDTCIASILYCCVQCNNYIYLLFITWDTSDQSCRWRGYFEYMCIVSVVYSYLLQAVSRFVFIILSSKYRWITSFKTHFYLIFIKWIMVFAIPLPAILTHDIVFRKNDLCWVLKKWVLHITYTILVYYIIPIVFIVSIYIYIYRQIRYSVNNTAIQNSQRNQNRDLEVLRNILIFFSIYILGGSPILLYNATTLEFFYVIGIATMTLAVTVEKMAVLLLDREIRNTCKKCFCRQTTQVIPIIANTCTRALVR